MTARVVNRPAYGSAPPFARDWVVECDPCGGLLDRFKTQADAERYAAAHRCGEAA